MLKSITVREFFQQFPDDDACLAHLFGVRFGQGHVCPKCEREARWYPIKAERAFSCQWCGHHIHPTVGTIFEKSSTSLQTWFHVIFLFTTRRHAVSGKEIQRQTGVTYKTAWRMGQKVREHMAGIDGENPLGGVGHTVEIDETMVGSVRKGTMVDTDELKSYNGLSEAGYDHGMVNHSEGRRPVRGRRWLHGQRYRELLAAPQVLHQGHAYQRLPAAT